MKTHLLSAQVCKTQTASAVLHSGRLQPDTLQLSLEHLHLIDQLSVLQSLYLKTDCSIQEETGQNWYLV